jgi:hypothetical protein
VTANNPIISNLESHPALHQVPGCQTLSYLCYQVGEQFKRIILGLSDHPKSIATGSLVVQFKRFKRDAIRNIPILKMEGVGSEPPRVCRRLFGLS